MKKTVSGKYRFRVVVLVRSLAAPAANGEQVESWPDPGDGSNEYWAARDVLTASETIAQGVRQSSGHMKLRIKGRSIAVTAVDRLRMVATGEVFNVSSVAREVADTVITVERAAQQSTPQ
mgnify:CR=1 FL=1